MRYHYISDVELKSLIGLRTSFLSFTVLLMIFFLFIIRGQYSYIFDIQMQDLWVSFISLFRAFYSYEYTQFLFKSVYLMHFLPHFWVKIRSKMGKMHRLYHKTCAFSQFKIILNMRNHFRIQ